MRAVTQTTVQCVVVLGFQVDFKIFGFRPVCFLKLLSLSESSNFLQSIVHIERPSPHARVVVLENANKLVVILLCTKFFVRSPELMTTMRRPGRLFQNSQVHSSRPSYRPEAHISESHNREH